MEKRVVRLVLISVLAHEIGHVFGLSEEYCSIVAGSKDEDCNDGGQASSCNLWGWQYDKNPLKASLGCDPFGRVDPFTKTACCNYDALHQCAAPVFDNICCKGNIYSGNGRSIMSFADADRPRGFDTASLDHLNTFDELKCD